MERIADDGAPLLDHLGIEKAVVGGCSMGGYAAFAFVRRHPQRLAGLVLQDTRAGADTAEAKANRATLAAKVLAEGASAAAEAFLPKLVGETTHRERPALVARPAGAHPRHPAAGHRERPPRPRRPRGLARDAAHDRGAHPGARGRGGRADAAASEAATMAAAIPRARLDVIPGAGHLANLENPGAVNAALRAFLAR